MKTTLYKTFRALGYQMDTHCQTAARSRSGERQNLGVVSYFWGSKGRAGAGGGGGRSTSNLVYNRGSKV